MTENYTDIFYKNIKKIMNEKNITQEQLANKLHTSQSSISKCLNNKTALTPDMIYNIAKVLNVSIDELFSDNLINFNNTTEQISSTISVYDVCTSIATIYKSLLLSTKEIEHPETVYMDNLGISDDPEIKYYKSNCNNPYTAIFFPNYSTVEENIPLTFEERSEYYSYLSENGNLIDNNVLINTFISLLNKTLESYKNKEITKDEYIFFINYKLSNIINEN